MTTVAAGATGTATLAATSTITVTLDPAETASVTVKRGSALLYSQEVRHTQTIGPYLEDDVLSITSNRGTVDYTVTPFAAVSQDGGESSGNYLQLEVDYSGAGHSFQPISADLTVAAAAGSDDGTDPKFLAPVMGNLLGADIAGEGNYLVGVIGAYSATGTGGSDYPKAGVMGVIMDGSTDADAIVMAVIDGDDPSTTTHARAAFGVAQFNNSGDSSVDYGLDLKAAGSTHYTGTGDPFTVDKAEIRGSKGDWCVILVADVPVDYTDGTPPATGEGYAGIGSLVIDYTHGKVYVNGGTKAQPLWKIVTSA